MMVQPCSFQQRFGHRLLSNTGLVLVNWVVKLINDPVEDRMAWAEFEGIA